MSNSSKSDPTSENKHKFWKAHIERWHHSGLSQVAYCRDNGLKPHQFTYWKKRLAQANGRVSFVPLEITNLPVPFQKSPVNLITPNGYRIEVGVGFDPTVLRQLVGVLKTV